jgi:hypothetical protein
MFLKLCLFLASTIVLTFCDELQNINWLSVRPITEKPGFWDKRNVSRSFDVKNQNLTKAFGKPVLAHEHPYMAFLIITFDDQQYRCGGSLIGEETG